MTPSRPKWNHPAVKTAATARVIDDAVAWAAGMGVRHLSDDGTHREFTALLTLAVIECADAYEAARYLELHYEWPVDGDLVRVLDRAYMVMPNMTAPFVHAWVMANKIRFPAAKGNTIRFRIGDAECTGVVVDVLAREARGWAEILNIKQRGKVISVLAEDVIQVTSTGDGRGPNNTPPSNGGTPVAARGGAILRDEKKARAA
jgi:hypothetical protein